MGLMGQQGVNLGVAYAEVVIDFSKAQQAANTAFSNIERGLAPKLNSLGQNMQTVGRNITLMTAPLTAFVTQGVFAFANFDEVLTEIQARTGATSEEMERLEQFAIQMGQETAFSATEASQAMLELLSSGSSLEEAMVTLPHVLNLAASSGVGLGESADALTDILAQFQLGVESSAEVVQSLSAATQKSSATMPDLIAAFANVGPIAKNMGLDIDETAAVLAVFAENGIKGAEAGTQLKSMLQNMTRPTEDVEQAWADLGTSFYDAQGNMRPIDNIIDDINKGLADKTPEEANEIIKALGGSYGSMGLTALLATDGIDTMQASMAEASDVTDLADAKMNSFKGVVNQLKSSISTLSIVAIGPLVEKYLEPLIKEITPLLNQLTAWMEANPELTAQIGALIAVLIGVGPVLYGLGSAIMFIASPLGLISIGVLAIVAALGALYIAYTNNLGGFGDAVDNVASSVIPVLESIVNWFSGIADAIGAGDWDAVSAALNEGITSALDAIKNVTIDAAGWLQDTIINPLVDTLKNIDWMQVLSDVGNLVKNILMVIGSAEIAIATWVYDNIITPLYNSLKEWVDSGQASEDLKTFGEGFISALKGALDLTVAGLEWVKENLIDPLIDKIEEYVSSGDLATDIEAFAKAVKDAFIAKIKFDAEAMVWVYDNLIKPMIDALVDWMENDAETDLETFATGLLDTIISIIKFQGDAGIWLFDNILKPIIDGLTGLDLTSIANAAETIGTTIMSAIESAIKSGITIVESAVKSAINAIIPDNISISIPSITIPNPLPGDNDYTIGGGSANLAIPNPFPGYAEGGMMNGPGFVGEDGIEMFVPKSSGMVISNSQLATALNVLGSQARGGVFGNGQQGSDSGVTVNGGIQITIDKSAIPAGASSEDVANSVWEKFNEAIRRQGGGTVSAS